MYFDETGRRLSARSHAEIPINHAYIASLRPKLPKGIPFWLY